MERPALVDSSETGHPSRAGLFLFGLLGLLLAVAIAVVVEGLLGGGGRVSKGFFVAVAALTPVLGLGLLVQLVAVLSGRTRDLLRALKQFNEEIAGDSAELNPQSQEDRFATWEATRDFLAVLAPFVAGLALQLVVTEAVAIYCIAADVGDRGVALAVGIQVFALLNYVLFFSTLLKRLARRRKPAVA